MYPQSGSKEQVPGARVLGHFLLFYYVWDAAQEMVPPRCRDLLGVSSVQPPQLMQSGNSSTTMPRG